MKTALLIIVLLTGVWSAINPHDMITWLLESFPVIVVLPILIATHKTFPLTPVLYVLIALHACILLIGAHYTYALTPIGEWLRDIGGFSRNHYDRIGHFMQGFTPALAIRELLLRTSPLQPGRWLFAIIIFACLGISALYEVAEWIAAAIGGGAATAFLGTQGDVWDTQKDMALAGIGAVCALLAASRLHDRALARL